MKRTDFPRDFLWGGASAAYQIEGAVAEGGRGPSIWDTFCRVEGNIAHGESGEVACDHYHRWREDVAMLKSLGFNSYRFSISWSRIFPQGDGAYNPEGMKFYESLVDELLAKGIKPCVTLYHWDLPQSLQDRGGWAARETVDAFVGYAKKCFEVLGDRVGCWITHNEPWVVAFIGNKDGRHAPGIKDMKTAIEVSHHLNLSHALAVQAYKSAGYKGDIGITLNLYPAYPLTESAADKAAAIRLDGYFNRWFLDPALKGHYPDDILAIFREKFSAPTLRPGDMESIKANPADFIGVNYYFRKVVKDGTDDPILGISEVKPKGLYTEMNWEVHADGLRVLLCDLASRYDNPRFIITENGAAFHDEPDAEGFVEDELRRNYIEEHIAACRDAVRAGVRLEGYLLWSIMDNFEWGYGYDKRFGIVSVDYASQKRTPKRSALWYKDFLAGAS